MEVEVESELEGKTEENSKLLTTAFANGAERDDIICDGKYVVVERGDQQRIILFKANQTIVFGKGSTQQDILLEGALGSPFLSAFKASPAPPDVISKHKSTSSASSDKGKPWKKSGNRNGAAKNFFILEKSKDPVAKSINEFYQLPDSITSGVDNRNLVDDNSSQVLKTHDIASLREQGISSKEILDTLITNSKSFSQKTEYAQEKYLKKKEKIYGDVLMFHKPSVSFLAEYYYNKDPVKVLGLRPDTVSQILSFSNVHANGKYLVFDNGNGLIVAAVLQRLGGFGQLLHCHVGSNPSRQALACLNFTEKDLKPMMNLDMLYLLRDSNSDAAAEVSETFKPQEPETKKRKLDEANNEVHDDENEKCEGENNSKDVQEHQGTAATRLWHINNKEDNEKSLKFLFDTEFDGLIICAKEHPLGLFQQLVSRLALSAPFVIYCQFPEPLMDCYVWVKDKGFGCNVHLVDNWFRNIQVAPERTHPEIQMSPSGGYLLFGTCTDSS